MKFIIDAHLPPSLCNLFKEKGHDAIHTRELVNQNDSTDIEIIKIAREEERIVITKDSDFYYSHIIDKKPKKLILVKTGNLRTKDLKNLFSILFDQIIKNMERYDLIEVHKKYLVV